MKLLGVADLAKRWNYTKQGVHQKLKQRELPINYTGESHI